MAKKATPKANAGGRSTKKSTASAKARSGADGAKRRRSSESKSDPVDALIRLLQSPLVIDLLAVGATAALAAITEHRSSGGRGGETSGKAMKAAGKAAAAAVGRRLASEFEEIRKASKKTSEAT